MEFAVPALRGLRLYANVRHFGDAPTDDTNDPIIPSYTLVGAGVSYGMTIGGRDTTLRLNINNLPNERYWGLQNFGETTNASLSLTVNW